MSEPTPLADAPLLADPALRAVVEALRAPGTEAELVGQEAVVAAFVAAQNRSTSRPTRRSSVLSSLLASKIAMAAAVGAVTVGGTAAAAYTGTLPGSLQGIAHRTIGAPEATDGKQVTDPNERTHPGAERSEHAKGPDATGPAAFGLCTAFEHGGLATPSTAYASLERAAGGKDRIKAYCAAIRRPGEHPTPTGAPSDHPTGMPTDHPTGMPSTHPTGMPTGHPTGHPTP
ncbi:MAG: hypothetical protein HYR62_03085 [Actinobacteria bacterium]|nr:hypothetical protein [Actinomycetota bacterium]MBI3686120.1 hypothetical protein [Actinomycetota bacterium]